MANEKRLISLDEALEATHKEVFWTESEQAAVRSFLVKRPKVDTVEVVLSFLAKLPKVDAVEVVHGRWLTLEEYSTINGADMEDDPCSGWIYCSECGKPSRSFNNWNYCPECGAKMDGGADAGSEQGN